jgi:hypothetical protein
MPMNFKGLEVTFEVNGVTYQGSLDTDLQIDAGDLNGEFQDQARRYAWWAALSELAKDKQATLKHQLDKVYARLDYQSRAQAVAATPPVKLTEKMVENEVITSPVYEEAMQNYLQAKKEYGLLMAGREAMGHRKEMLISLGANYRAQANDPVITNEKARVKASVNVDAQRHVADQKERARQLARQSADRLVKVPEQDQGVGTPTGGPIKRQPLQRPAKEE